MSILVVVAGNAHAVAPASHTPLPAAGELAGPAPRLVGEPDLREHLGRAPRSSTATASTAASASGL